MTYDYFADQAKGVKEIDGENYAKAVELVKQTGTVSIAQIQRGLQLGYNRAARIVETMEYDGIVSEADQKGRRTVVAA